MQHTINPQQHGPRGQAMSDAIQACVHCGFCLPACPTYDLLGEEMDSPRGRIYLMKNVLEGNLSAADAQPYIDRCLGCMGCVPACPSGVPYGNLLTGYRALQEEQRSRSALDAVTRRLIIETLPYPARFRLAAATGKIGRLVQKALPEKIGAMLSLLPPKLPPVDPLPAINPARGTRRARVALLTGCVQAVLAPQINRATVELLTANGVEVVVPKSQGCCGSILMHIGEDGRAQQLARHNLSIFPDDVDAIITNAAGCGSGIHEYGLLFAGDADQKRAETFSARVQDVTVFLANLGLQSVPPEQPARRVAYHDACHLAYAQGIVAPPRRLLGEIPNCHVVEIGEELCCGSAGTYNLEQPELADRLGQKKARAIIRTDAEEVIMGNIGCMTQIETHLRRLDSRISVRHTVELLAEAYSS